MQIPLLAPTYPEWIRNADYSICKTKEEVQSAFEKLEEHNVIALDTETTGLNPNEDRLVGLSLSGKIGEAFYIPINHSGEDENIGNEATEILKSFLRSKAFLFHNAKFDYKFLLELGVEVDIMCDTMFLASYLSLERKGLKYLGANLLGLETVEITDLIQATSKKSNINFNYLPPEKCYEYACQDADLTLRLFYTLNPKAQVPDFIMKLEMDLIPIIAEMELNGFPIDLPKAEQHNENVKKRLEVLKKEITADAGIEFDIDSPAQLAGILYERLGLKSTRTTAKGSPSTGIAALKDLKDSHPIVEKLIEWRKLTKLSNAFYGRYFSDLEKTGSNNIYSNFHPWGTRSGRFSSSDVNLQQVSKEVKEIFVPSPGHYLIEADYSQIEFRVFASMSKDPTMMRACIEERDMHRATAAMVFDKSEEAITDFERQKGKTLNFSILFGAGPANVADQLGISKYEASQLLDKYLDKMPEIKSWKEKTERFAGENGYCETAFGRKRSINEMSYFDRYYSLMKYDRKVYLTPEDKDKIRVLSHGLRIAINTPIQGTAADIFKIALRRLHRSLLSKTDIKLMAVVHDSVILSVPKNINPRTVYLKLKEAMEFTIEGFVPIKIDIEFGKNWKTTSPLEEFMEKD